MDVNKNVNFYYAKYKKFDIIELSKSKGNDWYECTHSSQLTAHSSQLTAHADYVIGRVFCQALKQAFSHFCEKVFYVYSETNILTIGGVK